MAAKLVSDLASIIDDLEAMGRLTRVTSEVDPAYDLAGLAYELEGGPRAILFEKVKGHRWPVLTGLYWNRGMLADLLRQDERTLPQYVSDCIRRWQQNPVDPVVLDDGPVLDVTEPEVDLYSIPVPVHAERDGGPYFDAAVVIAKDPETGVRNASIQRFMVVDKDTLRVNIDAGRHLELYLEKAARLRQPLTFTLNCGVGPGLHFAASTPAEAAPPEADELGIASEFHGAPVELVRASNGHDEMVAHAMWALECEIIPGEVADEGPFAEVTGYYASVAPRPVVHVRKIHRRANPVFQTILSGVEVWNSVGLLGEANVLSLLQKQVPGVTDVYFSHGGGGFYHAIVQMDQQRRGWSKQAILAAFAAFPPLKMVTVVDGDVDPRNASDVEWAMATRLDPVKGIVTFDESFGHGLNPSFPDYLGSKVGFDATQPYPPRLEYERVTYKPMALADARLAEPELRAPPPMATEGVGMRNKAETAAWEASLAQPQPIDVEALRGQPAKVRREIDVDDDDAPDPDAWIARPQPAVLAPSRGRAARRDDADDDEDVRDPDAWIARPQPIDLGAAGLGSSAQARPGRWDDEDDPDAWIARPRPARFDLYPETVERAEDEAAEDDDPDAWIARPQLAELAPARQIPAARRAAASPAVEEEDDPDAWIAKPKPADLGATQAAPPVTPQPSPPAPEPRTARPTAGASPRKSEQKRNKRDRTAEEADAALTRPQAAFFDAPDRQAPADKPTQPPEPAREPKAKPRRAVEAGTGRGGSSFFDAAAKPARGMALPTSAKQANGGAKPAIKARRPARRTRPEDEGGFFGGSGT